jgi:CheY-like chemotaxis protein
MRVARATVARKRSVLLAVPLSSSNRPARPTLHSQRVLVVDDHADIVDTFAAVLTLIGHEVRVAYDGGSAVEIAAAFRPDVIFLDIGLPVLDGMAVCRKIRQQLGSAVQIYAVTGYGDDAVRAAAQDAGFDGYFVKPVSPLEVLEQLELAHG